MIGNDWDMVLSEYFSSQDYKDMMTKVLEEYNQYECYPPFDDIFSAFRYAPFRSIRVVILGQDPYYGSPIADGLAFSVRTAKYPPSLVNIFKCLRRDFPNIDINSGNLSCWAKQGILLLNTALTVRKGEAMSHSKIGWEKLINTVLAKVNEKGGVVFMLWGSKAQELMNKLPRYANNLYLESVHPSPLSAHRGFLTSEHFRRAKDFLDGNIDFSVK